MEDDFLNKTLPELSNLIEALAAISAHHTAEEYPSEPDFPQLCARIIAARRGAPLIEWMRLLSFIGAS